MWKYSSPKKRDQVGTQNGKYAWEKAGIEIKHLQKAGPRTCDWAAHNRIGSLSGLQSRHAGTFIGAGIRAQQFSSSVRSAGRFLSEEVDAGLRCDDTPLWAV